MESGKITKNGEEDKLFIHSDHYIKELGLIIKLQGLEGY